MVSWWGNCSAAGTLPGGTVNFTQSTMGDVALVASPGPAVATLTFNLDGTVTNSTGSQGRWLVGAASAGVYEIRATFNSGTADNLAPSSGVWHTINGNFDFDYTQSTLGSSDGNYTIEIREILDVSNIDSTTATFAAEVF